jgi:hypothetical protein
VPKLGVFSGEEVCRILESIIRQSGVAREHFLV